MQAIQLSEKQKQPKAFYTLFFTEMWERFGYYSLQALLLLYLSKVFGFLDARAYGTFSAFAALVYATPIFGGYVADKLIGYQRTLYLGLSLLILGYTVLALPLPAHFHYSRVIFYLGLGVIIAGNGFFKTTPSSLLGKVYGANDPRIDSGFTLFYMSINIGSLLSMFLSGYIVTWFGWHVGFFASTLGLLLGSAFLFKTRRWIKNYGSQADFSPLNKHYILPLFFSIILIIMGSACLMYFLTFTHIVLWLVIASALIFYAYLFYKTTGQERNKLLACFLLTLFAIVFYCLYFQAPQSINLYIDRNVQHNFFGFFVPTPSFQALNSFWILLLAPILSQFYNTLHDKNKSLSIPTKFALGLIMMGFGFFLLYLSRFFANAQGQVSALWVVVSFLFQSLSELLVSALGLAMITKLAPPRFLAMMMGTWFLSTSVAAYLSGILAKLTTIPITVPEGMHSLKIYTHTFFEFAWITVAVGFVMLALVPCIKRLMSVNAHFS